MNWERLGRVADTISGVGFPEREQGLESGDLPFVKVSDLALPANGGGVVTARNWVTHARAAALGVRPVPAGSIIFPKVGAALLGNARAVASVECAIDNNLMAVVAREGCSRFWYYALRTVDLARLSAGGALPFVSDSAVRDLQLPLPGDEQQRRIADLLDDQVSRIDRIIAARRRQQADADESRSGRSRDAVLGLDDQARLGTNLSWAPLVGPAWKVRRLSHLARMGTGHTPSRSVEAYWTNCRIPWLTTSDVHRFRHDEIDTIESTVLTISELGLQNSAAVMMEPGTVALSRTASAGFSIIMATPMATSQDFVTWTCGIQLSPRFLLGLLRVMRPYLLGFLATGSTHKTIYFPELQDLRVPVPAIKKQQEIATLLVEIDGDWKSATSALSRSIDLLTEYKQSLISAAVTGDFDVRAAAGRSLPT